MNTALHLLALRGDSVPGTILRKRPDTSQLSDVFVDGNPEVMQGDVVLVLRVNAEGEHGFSYIRMFTNSGFADGFIRSSYLTLRPLGASVVAVAAVRRGWMTRAQRYAFHPAVMLLQVIMNRPPYYAAAPMPLETTVCGLMATAASMTVTLFKCCSRMQRASKAFLA